MNLLLHGSLLVISETCSRTRLGSGKWGYIWCMSMATMMAIMKMPRDGDRAEDRDALPRQPRLPVHWEFLNLLRISPTLQLTAWLFFYWFSLKFSSHCSTLALLFAIRHPPAKVIGCVWELNAKIASLFKVEFPSAAGDVNNLAIELGQGDRLLLSGPSKLPK